jgi:hypothetical protein
LALPIRRPGQGGGYLNNVAGNIVSINFAAGESGENEYGPWTAYSAKVLIQADGAVEPVEQYMPAGFLRGDNTISADGRTIEGADDYALDGSTAFGQFVVSLVEGEGNRFPEDRLGDLRTYAPVDNTRVTFLRAKDVVRTERQEKAGKATKRKDKKTGKEYDFDVLLVKEVLALPEDNKGAVKGAVKPAVKTATKATTKATKPAAAATTNGTEATDAALIGMLTAAPNRTLVRSKLTSSMIGYSLKAGIEGAAREAIRGQLTSDAYIADAVNRGLIVVDGDGKSASLILATE